MLSAIQLPAPDLIRAAAARLGGKKAEMACEALCKGLRIYPVRGGFMVSSFTGPDLYRVGENGCDCRARMFSAPCKHETILAILEIAQTLTTLDLRVWACVECKQVSPTPGLCAACLHPATMPALKKKTAAEAEAEMDALWN